jgi:hypothetical protein
MNASRCRTLEHPSPCSIPTSFRQETPPAPPRAINARVLGVMEALWATLPCSTTHKAQMQSTPKEATATSAATSPSLLRNLPVAWEAAASSISAFSSTKAYADATAPLPQSSPYLRCSREGAGMGQLLFTAGPAMPHEMSAWKRRWVAAKQVGRDGGNLS